MKKEKYVILKNKNDWFSWAYIESDGIYKNGDKKYKINADDDDINKDLLKRCKGGYSFRTSSSLMETLKQILKFKEFYIENWDDNREKRALLNAKDCIRYGYGQKHWNYCGIKKTRRQHIWNLAKNELAKDF